MRPTSFRHVAGKGPNALALVGTYRAHLSDLLPSLAGGKRHSEELAEGVAHFRRGGPNHPDLIRG